MKLLPSSLDFLVMPLISSHEANPAVYRLCRLKIDIYPIRVRVRVRFRVRVRVRVRVGVRFRVWARVRIRVRVRSTMSTRLAPILPRP